MREDQRREKTFEVANVSYEINLKVAEKFKNEIKSGMRSRVFQTPGPKKIQLPNINANRRGSVQDTESYTTSAPPQLGRAGSSVESHSKSISPDNSVLKSVSQYHHILVNDPLEEMLHDTALHKRSALGKL